MVTSGTCPNCGYSPLSVNGDRCPRCREPVNRAKMIAAVEAAIKAQQKALKAQSEEERARFIESKTSERKRSGKPHRWGEENEWARQFERMRREGKR